VEPGALLRGIWFYSGVQFSGAWPISSGRHPPYAQGVRIGEQLPVVALDLGL